MIIKSIDDKTPQLATLQALLTRPDATNDIKRRIEQEIRNIQAGIKGEKETAYEMDFHYGSSKNWMLIHDLRIECDGRVAQIDHLVINRFLEIWVCESKHFSEGLSINEHGECAAFYNGKPYGVPSPFEQNSKHIAVLESVFKTGMVKLPTRLGFAIKPSLNSLVLVSKRARINRPYAVVPGLETILKTDQFKSRIDKVIDADNNPLTLAKLIATDTLEDFVRRLAAIHKPVEFNWPARFGLPQEPGPIAAESRSTGIAVEKSTTVVEPQSPATMTDKEDVGKPKQKLVCSACNIPVSYAVAKFCWFNKPKFGGKVYCMDCQKKV